MSAPKCMFIFCDLFSLRLTENLNEQKNSQHTIYMFCLYHFSVKWIIKKNYLPPYSCLNILMLWCVFPSRWKIALWLLKMHLLPQFLTYKTSFCRELDCIDHHIRSFCVFDLVPVNKTQHKWKKRNIFSQKCFKIFFKLLLFKN